MRILLATIATLLSTNAVLAEPPIDDVISYPDRGVLQLLPLVPLDLESWRGKKYPVVQRPVMDTARPELQQEYYRLRQQANELGIERATTAAKCKTEPEYCDDAELLSQELNGINRRLNEIELQAWEEQR